jgi:hypothetical protein
MNQALYAHMNNKRKRKKKELLQMSQCTSSTIIKKKKLSLLWMLGLAFINKKFLEHLFID